MSEKIQINVVYSPSKDPPHKIFENEKGEIWNSKDYDRHKINVGMGWYSIQHPRPQDSILVVEPYCILERDYDSAFLRKFKYIFTWADRAMHASIKDKVVQVNHPTYHNIPNIIEKIPGWLPWDQRKDEIVIVANNKSSRHHSELYSLRVALSDVLNAYSSFEVSWYGQMALKKPYFKGRLENKEEALNNAKFSICTENSYDQKYTHNYFTEKMPDVWLSGAVPLYMGCYNINKLGNLDDCYIDLIPYVKKSGKSWSIEKKSLNDRIVGFTSQHYHNYKDSLIEHVGKDNILERYHSYHRVYEKMIDTFCQESNS